MKYRIIFNKVILDFCADLGKRTFADLVSIRSKLDTIPTLPIILLPNSIKWGLFEVPH